MNNENNSLPPVFFNHLYVVLDDKTYRAIQGSDFLRSAFPGKELRSTLTASGEHWSGTYFYCQDNYLEFFGESTGRHWRASAQVGWSGLAFSTDRPGGVEAIREKIKKEYQYEPFYELRKLDSGGTETNWFHYVRIAEPLELESFDSWVMEYHSDIFQRKNIKTSPSGELTRRAYLSPWNQVDTPAVSRERRRDNPLFSRVIGASITLEIKQAEQYCQVMQMLGYSVKKETGQMVLTGNRFSLNVRLRPETSMYPGYRVTAIQLEMVRPSIAPCTFVFAPGSRMILNENLTADWLFEE